MTLKPNQPKPPNVVGSNTIAISDYLWWWNNTQWPNPDNKYYLSILDFTLDMFPLFESKNLKSIKFTTINLSSPNLMFMYKNTNTPVRSGDELTIVNGKLSKDVYLDSPPSHIDYVYTGTIQFMYDTGKGYDVNNVLEIQVFRFSAYESIRHNFNDRVTINVNTNKVFRFTQFHFSTMIGYFQTLHSDLMVDPNIILQMNQWYGQSGTIPYKIEIVKASDKIKYLGLPLTVGQKIPMHAINAGHLTIDTQNFTGGALEFKVGNGYIGYFLLTPKTN